MASFRHFHLFLRPTAIQPQRHWLSQTSRAVPKSLKRVMSYLHSRRRLHQLNNTGPEVSPRFKEENKRQKAKRKSDLLYALGIVGSFLLVGLGLGYLILHHKHRKVILHVIQSPWSSHEKVVLHEGGHHLHAGAPRFVTVVMPSVVKPEGRTLRLQSIADTWGRKSRAVYVVHNSTAEFPEGHVLDALSHEYPQLLLVPPDITPDQGVPRLMHVIRTVSKQIDPDFAFFVNDHTFVIPEHLCSFLREMDPLDDMYLGHALKNGEDVFNSGAAGYILSRSTMTKLVKTWDEGDPKCVIKKANEWLQGNPGLLTATCLKHSLHIPAKDTRNDQGLHRFHAFGLNRVLSGKVDQWYINKHQDLNRIAGFDKSYENLQSGVDCCADDTISFHYVEHLEARALYSVRKALLGNPSISDQDLKARIIKEWPTGFKDLGGYAHGIPNEKQEAEWSALLTVLRRISSPNTQVEC